MCTPARARKFIIIIALVCFLVTVPTVFEWKISQTFIETNNETNVQIIYSDFGHNLLYKNVYYYSTAVLFVFLPLLILSVFNIFLIRSVRVSAVRRRTMTANYSQQSSLTSKSELCFATITFNQAHSIIVSRYLLRSFLIWDKGLNTHQIVFITKSIDKKIFNDYLFFVVFRVPERIPSTGISHYDYVDCGGHTVPHLSDTHSLCTDLYGNQRTEY